MLQRTARPRRAGTSFAPPKLLIEQTLAFSTATCSVADDAVIGDELDHGALGRHRSGLVVSGIGMSVD
jgi:hypothetical protein